MSDLFPRMVYQAGDQEEMHGARFNWMLAADQDALDALMDNGWYLSTCEATAASANTDDEYELPTRAEMEVKADELGIKHDGRTRDSKLLAMIDVELDKRAAK